MPQNDWPSRTATDPRLQTVHPRWREDGKWRPLATFLFVVLTSSIGWAAALYPILN